MSGWDALYQDPASPEGQEPLPGTDAYLAMVAAKKKSAKKDIPAVQPVDNFQEGTPPSTPRKITVPRKIADDPTAINQGTVSNQGTAINQGTVPRKIADKRDDGQVEITRNYMRLDMDVFSIIKELTEAEMRMYLEFLKRTYGNLPARNICGGTFRDIGDMCGIASPNAQVKAFAGLTAKGLVERLFRATNKKQISMFRVMLPSERPGAPSTRTVIRYSSSNRALEDSA